MDPPKMNQDGTKVSPIFFPNISSANGDIKKKPKKGQDRDRYDTRRRALNISTNVRNGSAPAA